MAATGVINGLHGSFARFVQHFPDAATLAAQFKFNSNLSPKDIATANVDAVTTLINGLPLVTLVANEDIPPFSQIGFDYTLSYWAIVYHQKKTEMLLFNKHAAIIEPFYYERLFVYLFINKSIKVPLTFGDIINRICAKKGYQCINIDNKFESPVNLQHLEFIQILLEEIKKQHLTVNTVLSHLHRWLLMSEALTNLTASYQEKFIHGIYFILLHHWLQNTLAENPAIHAKNYYIKKIINAIDELSTSPTADEVFRRVKKTMDFEEDKNFYLNHLHEMRREIISTMKIYNSIKANINAILLAKANESQSFSL